MAVVPHPDSVNNYVSKVRRERDMAETELPGVTLNQEYRVKLGKSFTFPKENAFHTIKCKCTHI